MNKINPKSLMIVGTFLMVTGVVLPFLILLKVLESTYFLNFFSYTIQVLGLILAMIGLVAVAGIRKKQ